MAITILSQPTTPNVSNTDLVFSISSSNSLKSQFQFLVDVYQGSDKLTSLYVYPNTTGNGIFNLSRILNDNLEYDNDWKTTGATTANEGFKTFRVQFSESYASSLSSPVTLYSGGVTSSLQIFGGTLNYNEGYNFATSASFTLLSNQPTGSITTGNHVTIPIFVPAFTIGGDASINVEFYNENNVIIASGSSGALAGAPNQIYQFAIGSGSAFNSTFETAAWDTIKLIESSSNTPLTYFKKVNNCDYQGVTFVWINKFGFYDYYSIVNPVLKNTKVDRKEYDKVNIDYSSTISTYDITRRGREQYYTSYDDRYQVTTDYLDTPTADWLTELFDSPNVYIQENGNFIPVNITSIEYTWRTNIRGQKTFQYNITYKLSNQRYSR